MGTPVITNLVNTTLRPALMDAGFVSRFGELRPAATALDAAGKLGTGGCCGSSVRSAEVEALAAAEREIARMPADRRTQVLRAVGLRGNVKLYVMEGDAMVRRVVDVGP